MIRVMVIDDEPTARKLLISSVDWNGLGMEIAGEASNGIEAINVIDDLEPDIAFVDISMPFMNGIDFSKIAVQRYPNLKIIILSAFDDFEYARECIKLPVVDYLLKPIDEEEIEKALKDAKKEIELIRERNQEESEAGLNFAGGIETDGGIKFEGSLESEGSIDSEAGNEPVSLRQITSYLKENYTDQTINLASVSQKFGFNSSYLSRKFKQETGKSFVEFLTECRMEKAIELAKENMKMFCTASEVGIPDPNYFGRCFKKYTGVSYSEYVATSLKNN